MVVVKKGDAGFKSYSTTNSTIHWMTSASNAISLSLSFPICKMDIIIKQTSQGCGKVKEAVSTECLARVSPRGKLGTFSTLVVLDEFSLEESLK